MCTLDRSNRQIKSHGQKLAVRWKTGENIFEPLRDSDPLFAIMTDQVLAHAMVPDQLYPHRSENIVPLRSDTSQSRVDPWDSRCMASEFELKGEGTLELRNAAYILCSLKSSLM